MTFTFHLVIPDRDVGHRVLLVDDENGVRLPRVAEAVGFDHHYGVADAARGIREEHGLEIAVLRAVLVEYDERDDDAGEAFLFAENRGREEARGGFWADEEAVGRAAIADPRARSAVDRWFRERRGGPPDLAQPWQRAGWNDEAERWIREWVADVAEIEQFSLWSGAAVLRIRAGDRRSYYFKAVPGIFRQEAHITAWLAERFPGAVPRPVAIDPESGWMVTEDFGDALVADLPVEHWEGALDAMLALHRAGVDQIASLRGAGFVDRPPGVLLGRIETLAEAGDPLLREGDPARLRAAMPRFAELAAELDRAPIPNTLVHGDFHAGNVARTADQYLIFDWTDACIAHPFVDLETFLYSFGPPSTDPVVRARLRDRYLAGWADLLPAPDAVAMFERAEPLFAMDHALAYLAILRTLDPDQRGEWVSHVPWWLDRALDSPQLRL